MAARSIEHKRKNKLKKVNVPELMFKQFMDKPQGSSALIDRLRLIKPTPRGRGFSRILVNLTHSEWDELYSYAAHGRKVTQGANRATELKPAICAKSLAYRMEALGVSSPQAYTISKSRASKNVVFSNEDAIMDLTRTASKPIVISRVSDLAELGDREKKVVHGTLNKK